MRALSRAPLASWTRHCLPLLGPRPCLAIIHSPCSSQGTHLSRPTYATKSKRKSKGHKTALPPQGKLTKKQAFREHDYKPLLARMRAACDARSAKMLMELYPSLVTARALDAEDSRRIAQALHNLVRNRYLADTKSSDVFLFAQHVVHDLQTGDLPAHPYAIVHLLGIFKECKRYAEGYAFWQWLVEQDDTFVSQAVYGAAIELMAYGRVLPLQELESIYADALKRFPGTFAEYHLSPDAIVPDRSQPNAMLDVPVLLLQGILTARILLQDWKRAYLALDTGLRIFPAQLPTRFFELFMTERPLEEAYTAFLVACRAGIVFKPSHLTTLIKKLRSAMDSSPTLQERTMILRAIANAIYAYLESGGTMENIHAGALIGAFGTLLPERLPPKGFERQEATLRDSIVLAAHEITSTLIQAGMPPSAQHLIALILLAGRLQVPDLLSASLKDVRLAGLDLGDIGNRAVITSAGLLGKKELIEEYWKRTTSQAEVEGRLLLFQDWVTLTKACIRTGQHDFMEEQLLKFDHTLSVPIKSHVDNLVEMKDSLPVDQTITLMELPDFTAEIEGLKSQIQNIAAVVMSGQPLDVQQTPFYMFMDPDQKPLGSPQDFRIVYDSYTLDPHQPAPQEGSAGPPGFSPTGIPLDQLRFQNWVSVVEMMDHADYFEKKRQHDIAHLNYAKSPKKILNQNLHIRRAEYLSNRPLNLEALQERIKQLR